MAKVKRWSIGDQLNAADLSGNFKNGGTGADGALAISSGTTNIDLGGAQIFVKNYTSISITGTANLTFSNPHANGTTIVFRSIGDITITTSGTISVQGIGAVGGAAIINTSGIGGGSGGIACGGASVAGQATGSNGSVSFVKGNDGSPAYSPFGIISGGPAKNGGGVVTITATSPQLKLSLFARFLKMFLGPGGGGAGGSVENRDTATTTGVGGRGGGALYIECGGALNFTSTINAKGQDGGASSPSGVQCDGAGGGGGSVVILYGTLTANSGTIQVNGGAAGSGSGAGADGASYVGPNDDFA